MSCNCSDQCSTPITIPTGNAGNNGTDGSDGIFGGFSSNWLFSSSTSTGPSATEIRLNNVTPASVAFIYLADSNANSIDMSAFLTSFYNGASFGKIRLYKEDDKTKFWLGTITAVTDNGTDFQLTVTHIQSNGTFTAADSIIVSFAPAGADGAIGAAGSNGTNGVDGVTVLHNDLATYSRSTASFASVASYTVPIGTLATNGSMLKIKLLIDKTIVSDISSGIQLYINGAIAHSGIGGSPSQFKFQQSATHSILEYTLHRISNTSAASDYRSVSMVDYQEQRAVAGFENAVSIGVLDFDGATTNIAVYIKGNGTDNVNLKGFSVEHYIK